jgi:predicted ArsR family transcriptional regulator
MRSERVPLGRPHFVFTLTENGRESLPGHQLHLVAAVIEAVRDLSPADTQGRTGREVAALVFERFSARLVAQCRRVVTASDLDSRVEQTLEVLSVAGLEFELDRCEEGYLVRGGACPCTRLLTSAEACGHEAGVLSGLIGSEVVMVQAAGNHESPAYLVRAAL